MFLICMYPHAPEQRLVCGHHYRLPGVSMGNRFIGVGGGHKFSKLQDLVIWKRGNGLNGFVCCGELCS